jgi:hypothetical protein
MRLLPPPDEPLLDLGAAFREEIRGVDEPEERLVGGGRLSHDERREDCERGEECTRKVLAVHEPLDESSGMRGIRTRAGEGCLQAKTEIL